MLEGAWFEEALIKELSSISELNNRIYPLEAPENVRKQGVPYIFFVSSYGVRTKSLDGYRGGKRVPVELNIIANKYSNMKSITEKVMKLLEGFENRVIGTNGPFIQELTYQEPVELFEHEPKLHRCVIDFNIFYEEAD